MLLKTKLQHYKDATGAKWEIIEQDYLLSWVLAGIASLPTLRENVMFKGGTCLRKCYFGDYRFSQDIDLSVLSHHVELEDSLEMYIQQACELSETVLQNRGENFYLESSPYKEKLPHPERQQAFLVQAKFPWHREFLTKVYIEVSFLKHYSNEVDKEILPTITKEKCAYKQIPFHNINDIFNEKLMLNVEEEWESWLSGIVVSDLPDKNTVMQDLKNAMNQIFH